MVIKWWSQISNPGQTPKPIIFYSIGYLQFFDPSVSPLGLSFLKQEVMTFYTYILVPSMVSGIQ